VHEAVRIIPPLCSKCREPMALHSIQLVKTPGGEEVMQVFECENCGRLRALQGTSKAA